MPRRSNATWHERPAPASGCRVVCYERSAVWDRSGRRPSRREDGERAYCTRWRGRSRALHRLRDDALYGDLRPPLVRTWVDFLQPRMRGYTHSIRLLSLEEHVASIHLIASGAVRAACRCDHWPAGETASGVVMMVAGPRKVPALAIRRQEPKAADVGASSPPQL